MLLKADPTISVVIPCFNQGHYLHDCLSSLNASTFKNFEIIIVNDGSNTSNTLNCLDEIQNQFPLLNIKIINQQNRGLSGARNRGILEARGEYIQLLDADDALLPIKFKTQLKYFSENSNISATISDYLLSHENIGSTYKPSEQTISPFEFSPKSFIQNWEKGLSIPIHCGLFKRSTLLNNLFTETLRAKEDWIFWTSLSENNTLLYHPESLVIYRTHSASMTKNHREMLLNWVKAQTYLFYKFHHLFTHDEIIHELIQNKCHLANVYVAPMVEQKLKLRTQIIIILKNFPWIYLLALKTRSFIKKISKNEPL